METTMNRLLLAAPNASKRKVWLCRLDRIAGDLNALLSVFAIGLATLDLTCLIGQHIVDRLPQVTRMIYVEQPTTPSLATGQFDLALIAGDY
jgi:hypothetical protein